MVRVETGWGQTIIFEIELPRRRARRLLAALRSRRLDEFLGG